jgi:hypothetical protein
MDNKSIVLEIRDYEKKFQDNLTAIVVLFLFGFGLLMIFIEVDDKIIGRYSVLIALVILIIGYLNIYFFRKPEIKGLITIKFDYIDFLGTIIKVEDFEYFAIRYMDYRGKIVFKRNEYPLPQFGTNNEIKLKAKSGLYYEANFFVARKRDRKKIDQFVYYWINKGIKLDYLIGDELIITNR